MSNYLSLLLARHQPVHPASQAAGEEAARLTATENAIALSLRGLRPEVPPDPEPGSQAEIDALEREYNLALARLDPLLQEVRAYYAIRGTNARRVEEKDFLDRSLKSRLLTPEEHKLHLARLPRAIPSESLIFLEAHGRDLIPEYEKAKTECDAMAVQLRELARRRDSKTS